MKRDRLKPYVYKVEGAVNFAIYDVLKGNFYQFTPEGTVEELRKYLLAEGLIFETEGIVPNKMIVENMWKIQTEIHIRNLQIRLNGSGEDNCWNRLKSKEQKRFMPDKLLEKLIAECEYIPIKKIQVEAEDNDMEKIEKIVNEFKFNELELNIDSPIGSKELGDYKSLCTHRNISFSGNVRKNVKKMKVQISNFFYSKYYNPCLGHQVAMDTGGEIKCCLWFDDVLGKIDDNHLKDMIISGTFDKYWELGKHQIESCKDCELRFACDDCRVSALRDSGKLKVKPSYCHYDPTTGQVEKGEKGTGE